MNKTYEKPIIEVLVLNDEDIIIMSSFGDSMPGLEDDDDLAG